MKKSIFSLLLALCVLLGAFAMAEELTPVELTDMGISISLPASWGELELTEEDIADGMVYAASNEDDSQYMLVYGTMLDLEEGQTATIDDMVAALSENYTDVGATTINNIPVVAFTAAEQDMNCVAIPNAEYTGMYMFMFAPASDADFTALSATIMNSMTPLA